VAHVATETRNESYAVMPQSSPGSGHEGDRSAGFVDMVIEEKSVLGDG
jgi:hypothetical protein